MDDSAVRNYREQLSRLAPRDALAQVDRDLALPASALPLPRPHLLWLRSIPLLQLGRLGEADQTLDAADQGFKANAEPQYFWVSRARASLWAPQGRAAQALALWEESDRLRQAQGCAQDVDGHIFPARLLVALGRQTEALAELEKAEALAKGLGLPEQPWVAYLRADICVRQKRFEEALQACTAGAGQAVALALAPDPYPCILRGYALLRLGRYEGALEAFSVAKRICLEQERPLPAKLHLYLGDTLGRLGRNDEAVLAFDSALQASGSQMSDERISILLQRANSLKKLGRSQEAMLAYEAYGSAREERRLKPDGRMQWGFGGVYCDRGEHAKGLAAYLEAQRIQRAQGQPENSDLLICIEMAYTDLGQYKQALKVHQAIQELGKKAGRPPESKRAWWRGVLLHHLGRHKAAAAAYAEAKLLRQAEGEPPEPQLFYNRAVVLAKQGNFRAANAELEAAANLAAGLEGKLQQDFAREIREAKADIHTQWKGRLQQIAFIAISVAFGLWFLGHLFLGWPLIGSIEDQARRQMRAAMPQAPPAHQPHKKKQPPL